MEPFNKTDIHDLVNDNKDKYYVPAELFDGMQYKLVRLEVKWAYVACLNVMIKSPMFDKENNAYIKDDSPMIIETLKKIANKKVDSEKIAGYLNELEEAGLVERQGRNVYLKRIVDIF